MAVIQLKRSTAARWMELNPILDKGEPGFEYDTKKLKVGDGSTSWRDLPYIGSESNLYFVDTYEDLPSIGDANCLYKVNDEKNLYQWNTTERRYETLGGGGSFDPSNIKIINGGNANG